MGPYILMFIIAWVISKLLGAFCSVGKSKSNFSNMEKFQTFERFRNKKGK